ncbi:MAG: MarR family transcriptional regulator [Candidatus Dormibacteraeota bacterium]|nr:MarR family transcriptional regulator [Candidatus Dormibacteraeota bacterium]
MNVLPGTTSGTTGSADQVQRLLHELQWLMAEARRTQVSEGVTLGEAQWFRSVLITIAKNPNITVNEIARQIDGPKSRVSVLVSTLAEQGILRREPDPHDRRLVHVSLTDQGKRWLHRMRDQYHRAFTQLLSPLGEEELATVVSGLELLCSVLRPAVGEAGFSRKEEHPGW